MNKADRIKAKARELGFDLVGIAPANPPPDYDFFLWWLGQDFAGVMDYLKRGAEKRGDPEKILPAVRSVICCGMNYFSGRMPAEVSISTYAWGDDYHQILGEKLRELEVFIQKEIDPAVKTRSYVDTGPVLERSYAARAGLGWIGKNTCLLNNGLGSYLFLGEILTTLELDYDRPALDQCGSCTKCLDACPTGALPEPYLMDARKCISYLTIERRGELTEEEARSLGGHIYGCDICQEVCPYNGSVSPTPERRFFPRQGLERPLLADLESKDEGWFKELTRGSAISRIKWPQWRRNLGMVRTNLGLKD